jgi:hypothetical protein
VREALGEEGPEKGKEYLALLAKGQKKLRYDPLQILNVLAFLLKDVNAHA